MTFYDVLEDIKKLSGLNLSSIRPGSNVVITEVDDEHENIILRTSSGSIKSRPIGELRRIWDELNRLPAVHVDGVLNGSGSSRNQPETILANLPYIEWLPLDGKKHIAFVRKNTHAFGTLKKMDAVAAQNISKQMAREAAVATKASAVIVTGNLSPTVSTLQAAFAGTISTITQGMYSFESATLKALVVSNSLVSLAPGTYTVLPSSSTSTGRLITLNGADYYVVDSSDLTFLVKK